MHKVSEVKVEHDIILANREVARKNRDELDKYGVKAFDILGAIGSGKTTMIEIAVRELKKYKTGVIAGDVVAEIDAARFRKLGVPVIAMNTGKECHLDAPLVGYALEDLNLNELDVIFIENVGNLICPTDFDVGAHKRVVIVSVSEGEDIVEKHPLIFRRGDFAIINKIDIAKFVNADEDKMIQDVKRINPNIDVIKTSAKNLEGTDKWLNFVETVAG
ncbi:MAG: hydrogenase nickel incorporation protein HypB [Candidatus Hydrothermarchaeales archaeon]